MSGVCAAPAAPGREKRSEGLRDGRSGERGMVLITVLWLLALLGGLSMAMSIFATSVVSAIDVYKDRPVAQAALEAGLSQAAAAILAIGPSAAIAARASFKVGSAKVSYRATGESARIDVNAAPAPLMAGLFVRLGASAAVAAAAANTIVQLRGVSAEAAPDAQAPAGTHDDESPAAIAALAQAGQPKPGEYDPHKPLLDVSQLRQIADLPPDLMARAAPYLTTYSGLPHIDPRLAAPELIESLPGMTRERVRTILALRDRPGPQDFGDALSTAKAFVGAQQAAATRIHVDAALPDGYRAAAEVVIIQYRDDRKPFRVLAWDDEVASSPAPKEAAP